MVSAKLIVRNELGLHARPANRFVKETQRYSSDILLKRGTREYNAKSIVRVLSACVKCGDEIELVCEGVDEESALAGLTSVIETGLGD